MSVPRITLGQTDLEVGTLGLGSSFGVGGADLEWAFDQGCNYLYWGSLRRGGFGKALKNLSATRRDELVLVVQSYARFGGWIGWSLERGLKRLGTDYADVLLLGMWNKPVPDKILAKAERLREAGKIRYLAVSTHYRENARRWLEGSQPGIDIVHVRYNAAHRGAEKEIFEAKTAESPGVVAFTATRWGTLCKPPDDGGRAMTGEDCFRFALSHPAVDVVLAGPKDRKELEEAIAAAEKGPLADSELTWMREHGDRLYNARKGKGETGFIRR